MVIDLRPGNVVKATIVGRLTTLSVTYGIVVAIVTEDDDGPVAVILGSDRKLHSIRSMWLSNGDGAWWWPTVQRLST